MFFFFECISIYTSGKILKNDPNTTQGKQYRINFSGWDYHQKYKEKLFTHIQKRIKINSKSENLLDIVLYQHEPIPRIVYILNQILFTTTFSLFPKYNRSKLEIEFSFYEQDNLKGKCRYSITHHELMGIVVLPFSPFFWPTKRQSKLIQKAGKACFE